MDHARIDRETAERTIRMMRDANLEFMRGMMSVHVTLWEGWFADMLRVSNPYSWLFAAGRSPVSTGDFQFIRSLWRRGSDRSP